MNGQGRGRERGGSLREQTGQLAGLEKKVFFVAALTDRQLIEVEEPKEEEEDEVVSWNAPLPSTKDQKASFAEVNHERTNAPTRQRGRKEGNATNQ